MSRMLKRVVFLVLLVALAGAAALWFPRHKSERSVSFRTVAVRTGDLTATISATGTVEPEEVVDVGAQVAGMILSFGKDQSGAPIDYGSRVEEGTVLARIDDSLYAADTAQATAQLEQAQAGVQRAQADLGQYQAKLTQAERDWNRARKLGPSDALSQTDYDAAQSGYEVAKANLAVGKAALLQAQSSVTQAEASLKRSQRNLDYCTIKSPVRGMIIDRRVNIGQTVVASLNAPSLFLIAKDLRRMQVWVSVNEADIGSIHPGQQVAFTVDAYSGETFQGEVGKIRLNASMTQNVVTYTVEVHTDNSSGKLLPYLTANAKFLVNERRNVMLVPNAALRFTPQPSMIEASSRENAAGEGGAGVAQEAGAEDGGQGYVRGTLWTREGEFLHPIPVQAGLSDGTMTEVRCDALKEGTPIVVAEEQGESSAPAQGGSPFTPRFFGGGKGGGKH